jgi:hypothetical protein
MTSKWKEDQGNARKYTHHRFCTLPITTRADLAEIAQAHPNSSNPMAFGIWYLYCSRPKLEMIACGDAKRPDEIPSTKIVGH